MNINILEQVARKATRGEDNDSKSMLNKGMITPAEHRSIESLSSQIVANVRFMDQGNSNGVVALKGIYKFWQ